MKVTLLTASGDEYWNLMCNTVPNKLEYCLRWGIQLSLKKHTNVDPKSGERQRMTIDALKDSDWVWFMGADTLIMNHTIDVNQFLDNNYDFIISEDYNGINNDVVFVKNTKASIVFLEKIIDGLDTMPNDQEVMKTLFNNIPDFKHKIIPQKLINAYIYDKHVAYVNYPKNLPGTFEKGDFIVHFPGMGLGARIQEVKNYKKEVVR